MATKSVKRGTKTSKPTRNSNAFAAFEQFQLQEFKEAFHLLDKDRDGLIGVSDLESAFSSLGKSGTKEMIKEMLDESKGPLNFTMFLTLFADRMANTDNENTILNALTILDDDQSGWLFVSHYLILISIKMRKCFHHSLMARHFSCVKKNKTNTLFIISMR